MSFYLLECSCSGEIVWLTSWLQSPEAFASFSLTQNTAHISVALGVQGADSCAFALLTAQSRPDDWCLLSPDGYYKINW